MTTDYNPVLIFTCRNAQGILRFQHRCCRAHEL
jgi:hypothetical protein